MKKALLIVALLAVVAMCEEEVSMKRPLMDNRKYFGSTLENGMQVLIVQDTTVTTAQVSVGVGAGSMEDPLDFPGLAHFMEHMLFVGGSEKYPKTTLFSDCISKYMGDTNAYTAQHKTLYYMNLV